MKKKTVFVCQQCGNEAPKWSGQCLFCGEWNSLVETTISAKRKKTKARKSPKAAKPQKLSQIKKTFSERMTTGIGELDRVLGGGIVPGSVVLLAGEPGIGKSTLVLQLATAIAKKKLINKSFKGKQQSAISNPRPRLGLVEGGQQSRVLYISGEESLEQIKIRADRLNLDTDQALFLSETDVDTITGQIEKTTPQVAIIDSVQTLTTDDLSSGAGTISQVKECTSRLIRTAKRNKNKTAVFLIGHVTKEGSIAGPKTLEHMVDTVITLEGEKFANFRILRTAKNRFGATSEVGIFEMTDKGMQEVKNPSKVLIKDRLKKTPGSVVVPVIEGTRPVLVEIQALVVSTQIPTPRRVAQGIDYNRLQMIVAVLGKRLGLRLGGQDITVNVAGGIKIQDPGADLGVALAIYSSFKNIALPSKTAVFGELGLLGELRPVFQTKRRIKEANRLGFERIISPDKFSTLRQVVNKIGK